MSVKIKTAAAVLALVTVLLTASCEKAIEKREDTTDPAQSVMNTQLDTELVESEPETLVIPEYTSPLTGLGVSEELAATRPVAVMINNIRAAMPQEGTSYADVIYECIVEGAQTRLMAVYLDYANVPAVGSVRSSREYYLDFAMNHDAIYVHAGGSDEAYKQIKAGKISNLDGVNMYLPDSFYRDAERLRTKPLEHTLMTSGEGIVGGIEYRGYRAKANESFAGSFNFVEYGEVTVPENGGAKYVSVEYSDEHAPYYIYNEEDCTYERWQFDEPQVDSLNDEQLAFDNIIIQYCKTYNTGDSYGHYNVKATGEGKGVYITRGASVEITWKKPDRNTPVSFYTVDGEPLYINRGKTMMQICTESMQSTTVIAESVEQIVD